MNRPKKGLIFLFWILFSFLSTFFAEALSGSAPDFFFTSFGYYGIFPIYALHSLLLATGLGIIFLAASIISLFKAHSSSHKKIF